MYERAGKEETLARIGDSEGQFTQGGRYIFALDLEGNLLAHPSSKQLVGQNLTDLTDSDGRRFIRELLATVKTRGYGFADYKWPVLDSKEELHKTVFFERVDGMVLCRVFHTIKGSPFQAVYGGGGPYGPPRKANPFQAVYGGGGPYGPPRKANPFQAVYGGGGLYGPCQK